MTTAPLRVGVIGRTGAGGYGHQLDLAFTADARARIVAVADSDEQGRTGCLRRTGAARGYPDHERMLDGERLDIVVVAPRQLDCHEEMVLAALRHGAHVYCEKPIAQSLDQADRMVRAARDAGRLLGVALPAAHEPRFAAVRAMLAGGELGDLLQLRGVCKWDHRGGGEDFLILGVHFADLIRRLAGDALSCSAQVSRQGRPITRADAVDGGERCGPVAGDRVWASYETRDGVVATIESWRAGIEDRTAQPYRLEVHGTRGIALLRAPYADHSLWVCDGPVHRPGASRWRQVPTAAVPAYGDYHRLAATDFLDAVRDGRPPRCSGQDGRAALEMIHAAYWSQLEGRRVGLPLARRVHPLAPPADEPDDTGRRP